MEECKVGERLLECKSFNEIAVLLLLWFWVFPEKKLKSCKVKAANLRTSCIVAAACSTASFPHCHFSKVRTAKYYYYYYVLFSGLEILKIFKNNSLLWACSDSQTIYSSYPVSLYVKIYFN
jgi:hypothetical protein